MKIYVITSGMYSDYGIEAIFLDKEKAENYVKYHGSGGYYGDLPSIEEWDTSDEEYQMQADGHYVVSYSECIWVGSGKNEYPRNEYTECKLMPPDAPSHVLEERNLLYPTDYSEWLWYLSIKRCFRESEVKNEKGAKKKVEKIFHDMAAQLKSAIAEGATIQKACMILGLKKLGARHACVEE